MAEAIADAKDKGGSLTSSADFMERSGLLREEPESLSDAGLWTGSTPTGEPSSGRSACAYAAGRQSQAAGRQAEAAQAFERVMQEIDNSPDVAILDILRKGLPPPQGREALAFSRFS